MTAGATVLTISGATRRYDRSHVALDGADLDLHAGRITALLGPSGSGKSTLLRAIAGLERLDGGTIALGATRWSDRRTHLAPEKRKVGMVFQDYALFPHLTALANVAFGLRGSEARKRALAQLEAVELAHKAKAYPHELSGGEQQRVALARALAPSPAVVLLDEPFSGLDRRLRGELREQTVAVLREAGATALIVTHDAEEAMAVADELALMDRGQVIQTGTPEEVWTRPSSAVAARLLGDVAVIETVVKAGTAATPLGPVAAPDLADATPVHVLIRPQAIGLTPAPDAPFTITARRAAGTHVAFTIADADGRSFRTHTPVPSRLAVGDAVAVALDEAFVTVVGV